MRMIGLIRFIGATGIAITLASVPASAQGQGETVKTAFEHAIPNIPGKSLVALEVTYPPGGKSPSHRHAKSAFIYAHVLSGAIRSQVNDEPVKVYRPAKAWYEVPGSHHRVSENASATEPAQLLAVFIVDARTFPWSIPDQK